MHEECDGAGEDGEVAEADVVEAVVFEGAAR